jgi:hypothetical protein
MIKLHQMFMRGGGGGGNSSCSKKFDKFYENITNNLYISSKVR